MRILDLLIQKSVPEWARCYYDYEGVKIIIRHAQNSLIIIQKMKDFQKRYSQSQYISQSQESFNIVSLQKQPFIEPFKKHYQTIMKSVRDANKIFFEYHLLNKNIVFLFLQMKIHEINKRIDRYQNWTRKVNQDSRQAYVEGKMIYRMCEVNLMAYKKVQKKHIHNFQNFNLDTPVYNIARVSRTMDELEMQFIKLENLYLTVKQPYPKKARTQFYEQLEVKREHESIANYFFGLSNGISISLILVSILIYAQSGISSHHPKFTRDFPVWRAVGYIILYLWAFSLNIVVFQKYKIDYQLVFGFKQMTPRASSALALSSGFTLLYMVLFVFYLLDLTELIQANTNIIYWFPLIIWGVMLGYLLNPFPIFNFHGRVFFFKQILLTIASPFMRVYFNVIFISQQFVSLILPFADIIYSFCYYIGEDLQDENTHRCEASLHSAEYFGFVIFGYRIIQSLKVAHTNKKFFYTRQMFIVLKGLFNFFIMLISLLSSVEAKLVYVWYAFAIPGIFFNYYVDLKWDWGLLQPNSNNKYLRNQVSFLGYEYYIIMGVNLAFRVSSMLTLSENIIYQHNWQPFYLIFVISVVQIIRRFFWNIIKVQREHALNCDKFIIRTDYDEQESIVINSLEQNDVHRKISEQQRNLQPERVSQETINLNEHIERKKSIRKHIEYWKSWNQQILENIENEIEEMYKQAEKKAESAAHRR